MGHQEQQEGTVGTCGEVIRVITVEQTRVTMPEKQLELSKRNAFFKDPFFQDMVGGMNDGPEKRLAEFSARSMGVAGAGLNEAAHNIQVSASNDKFMIQLELPGFAPEDFGLKTKDDIIIVEAVHEAQTEDGSTDSRKFTKEFKMPAGILTVSAPRVISAPEGAQVSEAMKAQSQAFVTDDGVAVKKDDKASSQSMAATTQSEDGSTISSFKSSSSSSSSSTMMSSGGPMPMMGGMGGMGGMQMPSLMGGQGGMQMQKMGDMDDMMSKMMSKMGGMSMGSTSMGSNSMSSKSSFSSSSSSSMMSSEMGGGMPPMRGMQMPQMGGFDMPGLSFREMPDMPLSSGGVSGGPQAQPEYTVTSPPMSPPPEMNHKVQKTEDYVPPSTSQTAEATVLLKVKEGDEYKLALNM